MKFITQAIISACKSKRLNSQSLASGLALLFFPITVTAQINTSKIKAAIVKEVALDDAYVMAHLSSVRFSFDANGKATNV